MEWNGPTGGHRPDASVMRNKSAIGEVEEEAPIPVDSPSPTPQLEIFSSPHSLVRTFWFQQRSQLALFIIIYYETRSLVADDAMRRTTRDEKEENVFVIISITVKWAVITWPCNFYATYYIYSLCRQLMTG